MPASGRGAAASGAQRGKRRARTYVAPFAVALAACSAAAATAALQWAAAWTGGRAPSRWISRPPCGRHAGGVDGLADFDLDLDSDDLEDDWGAGQEDDKAAKRPDGMSDAEAKLYEQAAEEFMTKGGIPKTLMDEIQALQREEFESTGKLPSVESSIDPEKLEGLLDQLGEFKGHGGPGAQHNKWIEVQLNDTWIIRVAQVPHAMAAMTASIRGHSLEDAMENFYSGDHVWPSAILLSRWLAIHPKPPVDLKGKVVLEFGAGVGLPALVCMLLGAEKILMQDESADSLREALHTAVDMGIAAHATTLQGEWRALPNRLLSASEESLQPFKRADILLGSDVLFSEEAARDVSAMLAELLQSEEQVAYVVDPYKREHWRLFKRLCKDSGLDVRDAEIVTWEPERNNIMENDEEWVCRLITVRLR